MKNWSFYQILVLNLIIIFGISVCDSALSMTGYYANPDWALYGANLNKKKVKNVKEPGKVIKAKKKQEDKQKQLKKEYASSVKASRQRSYDIQSPDVKARMKQNEKDTVLREKTRKKMVNNGSRKAGKKYR